MTIEFCHKFVWVLLLLTVVACTTGQVEKSQKQVRKEVFNLATVLESVHTKQELIQKESEIRKISLQLSESMITLKKLSFENENFKGIEDKSAGLKLKAELDRIYQINGCKQIYEDMTQDALYLLDAFDQKIKRPKAPVVGQERVLDFK
jgi:phage shock protein A